MRLLFLGTGPAEAIPRLGHTDPLCVDARRGGKSRRSRSAAIITAHGRQILLDAGPDIETQLDTHRIKKIDAVFLTHAHQDAVGGLSDLNHWLAQKGVQSQVPVYTDRKTMQRLMHKHRSLKRLRLVATPAYEPIRVGRVAILPFRVAHAEQHGLETRGYRFGKDFAYASDVADLPLASARLLLGIKTLVLDAAFYFGRKVLPSHLTTEEAIAWGYALGVERLLLTQTGHTYPPHDEAALAIACYLEEQDIDIPKVMLAYDGYRTVV